MDDFYRGMTQRAELVLGRDCVERISRTRVVIFGLGGVGSWCAEALVRSGIAHMTIVDSDVVCLTNLNRQLQATSLNIGKRKADEMRKRLLEINPEAEIEARAEAFTPETRGRFDIESHDYVIDAIDSVSNKMLLIELCLRSGKKILSSMGAGARSDPARIRMDKLSATRNCTLARVVRRGLRDRRIRTDFLCVYSEELPSKPAAECSPDPASAWDAGKKRINGALAHITGIFGLTLAGAVIRDIAGIRPIPVRIQK